MQNAFDSSLNARVYLDHNATTPLAESIQLRWSELFHLWGNPSSIHASSRPGKLWLRETKQKLSQILKCSPVEIIFNSGASEGNNTVLKSVWNEIGQVRSEFMISQVEHPSVIKTADYLESLGAVIKRIPVSQDGQIDMQFIKDNLSFKTALVSVMFANNETGTVFPIAEISQLAHASGALMHSDCVQMLGKSSVDFASLQLDYGTFSAHKYYSLKGTGFTFVKKGSPWVPLIHGGGQERARRGGTENILGIATLGIVLENFSEANDKIPEIARLRDLMENIILQNAKEVFITAAASPRLSNTSNMIISGVDGETLLMSLDLKGFSVSTGAACSSGNPEPSPVLLNMGLTRAQAQNSLRVSLGINTTESNIRDFTTTLLAVIEKLRSLNEINKEEKYDAVK